MSVELTSLRTSPLERVDSDAVAPHVGIDILCSRSSYSWWCLGSFLPSCNQSHQIGRRSMDTITCYGSNSRGNCTAFHPTDAEVSAPSMLLYLGKQNVYHLKPWYENYDESWVSSTSSTVVGFINAPWKVISSPSYKANEFSNQQQIVSAQSPW